MREIRYEVELKSIGDDEGCKRVSEERPLETRSVGPAHAFSSSQFAPSITHLFPVSRARRESKWSSLRAIDSDHRAESKEARDGHQSSMTFIGAMSQ